MIEREDVVSIGGLDLEALADAYGTPLYVYDASMIASNYERLQHAFAEAGLPVSIHYAMKANTNPAIVELLGDLGAGFDCASLAELTLALECVDPADVLFTAPYTPAVELQRAVDAGVCVNLDGAYLLGQLQHLPERLSFRIDPGHGPTTAGLGFAGSAAKFGIDEELAITAYQAAADRGVKSFGIHMMPGSGVLDPAYFERVTDALFRLAASITDRVDITFDFIDIGGGFGIPYRPDQSPLAIDTVARGVADRFDAHLETGSGSRPDLVVEPGRYLVGNAGVLVTEVTGIKHKVDHTFVGVDTGMHHMLRPMLLDAYHEIIPVTAPERDPVMEADVVGPICSTVDTLASERPLPELSVGDRLAVMDVGAYGYVMGSHFNSRPRPAEILVDDGSAAVIRERETTADIFAGTDWSPSATPW